MAILNFVREAAKRLRSVKVFLCAGISQAAAIVLNIRFCARQSRKWSGRFNARQSRRLTGQAQDEKKNIRGNNGSPSQMLKKIVFRYAPRRRMTNKLQVFLRRLNFVYSEFFHPHMNDHSFHGLQKALTRGFVITEENKAKNLGERGVQFGVGNGNDRHF